MKKTSTRKKASVSATVAAGKAKKTTKKAGSTAATKKTQKTVKKSSKKSANAKASIAKKNEEIGVQVCEVVPVNISPPIENGDQMISSMDNTVRGSNALFADSSDSSILKQRRKPARSAHRKKKGRHPKVVREKAFYGLDEEEMELDLDDRGFLDDDLVSLDEFDSILHETEGKTFNGRVADDCLEETSVHAEHRKSEERRKDSAHSLGEEKLERRKKVQRRRQIDPTTCERDYSTEQVEFMTALDEYKRNSGRMFPTCSEILEVLLGLGYAKVPQVVQEEEPQVPAMQEQAMISVIETTDATEMKETSSVPETIEILPVTFLTEGVTTEENTAVVLPEFEYREDAQPFLVNEPTPMVGVPILSEVFPPKDLGQTLFV